MSMRKRRHKIGQGKHEFVLHTPFVAVIGYCTSNEWVKCKADADLNQGFPIRWVSCNATEPRSRATRKPKTVLKFCNFV